jgi:hypothetical protein
MDLENSLKIWKISLLLQNKSETVARGWAKGEDAPGNFPNEEKEGKKGEKKEAVFLEDKDSGVSIGGAAAEGQLPLRLKQQGRK